MALANDRTEHGGQYNGSDSHRGHTPYRGATAAKALKLQLNKRRRANDKKVIRDKRSESDD